jgi:hypothetical protein
LAEEQQDQCSDPGCQRWFVGLEAAADEFGALLLGDQGLRDGVVVRYVDFSDLLIFDEPDDEVRIACRVEGPSA